MSNDLVPIITLEDEKIPISKDPVTVITLDGDEKTPSSDPTPLITLDECKPGVIDTAKNEIKRANNEERTWGKKSCNHMHIGLSEEDVGISQYVSSMPGFNAVIKQRYSDFHVNEIDIKNNIAKLLSLEVPKEEVNDEMNDVVDKKEILSIISEEDLKSIEQVIASKDESQSVLLNVTSFPKEERKKIHQTLKSVFKSTVYSNTVDKGNEKFIKVGVNSKIDDRRNRQNWESGEYLHFMLHKENMDHSQAVGLLSHLLRLKPNCISAAGTKDKRAKTTQWISIRRVKADRIGKLKLKSIWCGHYCYKKEPLKLGDLKGNQFRIALRNVLADDNLIEKAMESVRQRGFINYYGLQRFGSSVVAPTHIIGKSLLQKKWNEAVELILKPRPREKGDYEMTSARDIWWSSRNAKNALRCLRNPMKSIEGKLLLALVKLGPTAYLNALEKLPRCTSLLYVHGYQSYVWNQVVSRRIEAFGLAPIAGDLVLADDLDLDTVCGREELLTEAVLDPESEVTEESRSVMDNNAHSFLDKANLDPSLDLADLANTTEQSKSNSKDKENGINKSDKNKWHKINVKKLTQEDLQNARMEDLIYPLPGYDIEYPDNIVSKWYEEILAQDNLTTANFKQSVKLFSAPGSYRKMMCIPKDLSWEIIRYKNENDCLILSDVEEINGLLPPKSEKDASLKGIILKMCLPSCSYATMCLREITKSSTSVSHQASLTAKTTEAISQT